MWAPIEPSEAGGDNKRRSTKKAKVCWRNNTYVTYESNSMESERTSGRSVKYAVKLAEDRDEGTCWLRVGGAGKKSGETVVKVSALVHANMKINSGCNDCLAFF